MNRLSVRLFLSHLAAALVGGLVTFVLVRLLVPRLSDAAAPGAGAGGPALLIGVSAGVIAALLIGLFASWRLLEPLREMQQTTRQLAAGDYRRQVERPATTELADLAEDVNALAGALSSTDQRRVRLISEVTRQMRTPLAVIDGHVEGMVDVVAEPERLVQISTEVRKLRRLADDLSVLSRVEEGQLQLDLAEVDLAAIVERTVNRLEPQFDEAGVRLHTLMPGRFTVRADADQLGGVIADLLGNALRATRDRTGGEVLVGVARKSENGRSVARLTITDNGVGLADEELTKIFERFYRASSSREAEGSGVGLTIAREIVRAHDGELAANSPGSGRGATLTLTLPLV